MSGSHHFLTGVLRSTRSGRPKSWWNSSRLYTQGTTKSTWSRPRNKCGQCMSPQTKFLNMLRRWRRRSYKRLGQKCISWITTSRWWPQRPCYRRNASPKPMMTGRILKSSPYSVGSGANSVQKQTRRRPSGYRRGERRLKILAAQRLAVPAGGNNLPQDAPPLPAWKI